MPTDMDTCAGEDSAEAKDYTEEDLEASLRRVLAEGVKRADFIVLDGHTIKNQFLVDGINYGVEQGWLYNDGEHGDEQWTEYHYRLTDLGKEYFEIG